MVECRARSDRHGVSPRGWGAGILFALLVLLPFLDRGPRRPWRQRPVVIVVAVAVIAALVVLSALIAVMSVETHV